MNSRYKRTLVGKSYHQICIYECSKDILIYSAKLGFNNVTIENFTHFRNKDIFDIKIKHGNLLIHPLLNAFEIDFQISKQEFLSLSDIWNNQGCFAVFHNKNPLKFKATLLDNLPRYKALDQFEWNLELAIPDGTSHLGTITSPDKNIIDAVERLIKFSV